jgi:hypothetical protein
MNHYKRYPDPRLINSKNETKDVKNPILIQEQKTNPNLITQNDSKNETKYDKKDIPIPNALTITINTSVPGYQTIKYKPDMTIKSIDKDEKTIWFDPLVPLNQTVIDKVPENIRVLEFFNKGLFESLINSHGNKKQITLEQAKKTKIIDNNIQITLNNLFPSNGILYIKGEPYAIADIQWSKSDWKIDRKIKDVPEINTNKISDPTIYSNIVKNEIQIGNKQLQQLPHDLLYGVNFDKETEELSAVDREKELIDKKAEEARIKAAADAKTKALEDEKIKATAAAKALEDEKIKAAAAAKLKSPTNLGMEVKKPVNPVLPTENIVKPTNQLLAIENVTPSVKPQKLDVEIEDIQNIQMSPNFLPALPISQESTKIVRSYFGNNIFYSMISTIFKYMTEAQKLFIQNIFKSTTNTDVKGLTANISKAAYNFTITGTKIISVDGIPKRRQLTNGLRVISNASGGNCLFLAVADAINYYNYYSDIGNKILYNMYGNGDNLFTTAVLRNIVSTEIIKQFNSDNIFRDNSLEEGEVNLKNLNDIFERIMMTPESISINSPEYYNTTLLDVYKGNDNFFVIIPNNIPNENKNRPFKLVENNDEIKKYIESPYYWADQKSIDIFNKILRLNIIIIENKDEKFSIPYPTIKSNDNNTMWNKYLFLYNTANHYELITFDYLINKSSRLTQIKKTIFNKGDNIIPPFYIIFLIFSTFFVKLSPDDKKNVELFSNFLYAIQNSFNIINNAPIDSDKNIGTFIANFEDYFGPIREEIYGGAENNVNNRGSSKFLKKEDKQDSVQISFHITIDMELQKGTTLSKEQMSNIKCTKSWNKVRKSYADFTGKKYVIPPVYDNLSDKHNKKEEPNKKADNNNTKKNTSGGDSRGKRRRKTMKKYITK